MDLEAKKRELSEMQEELVELKNRFSKEHDNNTLGRKIESLNNDIEKLTGEVNILQRMELLERKYSNGEPINFHYIDSDGLSDDIELASGDINYDRAYKQQRDLLQLEYNHYNKLPLSYVNKNNKGFLEGIVSSDNDKYDDIYHDKRDKILNIDIIHDVKTDKKQDDKEIYADPGYRLLNSNGQIIVVGDIPLEKQDVVLKNIVKDYGQSALDNMKFFDTKTLTETLSKESMYRLANTDYYADMALDGSIGILNNDKVIYSISPKIKNIKGKKLISKDDKSQKTVEENHSEVTYIGGHHFKPNDLNSEYAVFKKDGYLFVIGNFTSDWLEKNYKQVIGDMGDAEDLNIKLWNKVNAGITDLKSRDDTGSEIDFGVKVQVSNDGKIEVIGDVNDLKYHNQLLNNNLGERITGKHFKTGDNKNNFDGVREKPVGEHFKTGDNKNNFDDVREKPTGEHFKTGDNKNNFDDVREKRDVSDLSNSAEKKEAVKGRKITRKNAKPSLIKRGIEKFKGLKKWQKVAIVAGVIAVVGVGAFVLGPQIINGINQLINPENVDVANKVIQASPAVPDTVSQAAQSIDYSSIGEGHTVFSNAADAANNVNGVISNQWFSNNPIDVFNTATNSYMGLTPDQLNDPNLLAELAKDPNNAMLFGNSMSDPSGFIGLDDVVNTVTKMR